MAHTRQRAVNGDVGAEDRQALLTAQLGTGGRRTCQADCPGDGPPAGRWCQAQRWSPGTGTLLGHICISGPFKTLKGRGGVGSKLRGSWLSGERHALVREMAAEATGVVQSCREGGSRGIRNRLKVKVQEKRVRQRKAQKKAARRTGLGCEERTGNSAGLLRSPHAPRSVTFHPHARRFRAQPRCGLPEKAPLTPAPWRFCGVSEPTGQEWGLERVRGIAQLLP